MIYTPFEELITTRRSVRQFEAGKPIPEPVLNKILQAAVDAPSAKNLQPYHIYVLQSQEAKQKFQACYSARWVDDAALYLLIVGQDNEAWTFKDGTATALYIDAAIATTHMMLKAWEEGVGSTWICAFDRPKCCQLFGLEMGKNTPISVLALGYPAVDPSTLPHNRKAPTELITQL